MTGMTRRDFVKRTAAITGGLAIAGPLKAFAARSALAQPVRANGYGELVNMGDLWLPPGFNYRIISVEGRPMSDGSPTPSMFDRMGAYAGPRGTTVLIRNHENRERAGEIPVTVPEHLRWDKQSTGGRYTYNGGNTKLVVSGDRHLLSDFAVLGGTSTNCAGGTTPWGAWISSEEIFAAGDQHHGFSFEIDADSSGPVQAVPIKEAGRFVHEAVAWFDGALYETEDRSTNAALYRYLPNGLPRRSGDLALMGGTLQALKIKDQPNFNTSNRPSSAMSAGVPHPVEWTGALNPEPASDTLRLKAQEKGAALFDRQEGIWTGGGRIFFACTSGGAASMGQIFEFDPAAQTLTLLYESPGSHELESPDNLVVMPAGGLLLCEDGDSPQFLRGLTPDGKVYDFARTETRNSEFAGACFAPGGHTLFVNQQGNPRAGETGVTYAIWGPWTRQPAP